jgi:hypothetical protein
MAKILNLDDIAGEESRELRLNGQTHPVREITVEDFIEINRVAARLEKGDVSIEEQMQTTIDLIRRVIPSLTQEELQKLTMDKLQAISAFVRGLSPEEVLATITSMRQQPTEEGAETAGK